MKLEIKLDVLDINALISNAIYMSSLYANVNIHICVHVNIYRYTYIHLSSIMCGSYPSKFACLCCRKMSQGDAACII